MLAFGELVEKRRVVLAKVATETLEMRNDLRAHLKGARLAQNLVDIALGDAETLGEQGAAINGEKLVAVARRRTEHGNLGPAIDSISDKRKKTLAAGEIHLENTPDVENDSRRRVEKSETGTRRLELGNRKERDRAAEADLVRGAVLTAMDAHAKTGEPKHRENERGEKPGLDTAEKVAEKNDGRRADKNDGFALGDPIDVAEGAIIKEGRGDGNDNAGEGGERDVAIGEENGGDKGGAEKRVKQGGGAGAAARVAEGEGANDGSRSGEASEEGDGNVCDAVADQLLGVIVAGARNTFFFGARGEKGLHGGKGKENERGPHELGDVALRDAGERADGEGKGKVGKDGDGELGEVGGSDARGDGGERDGGTFCEAPADPGGGAAEDGHGQGDEVRVPGVGAHVVDDVKGIEVGGRREAEGVRDALDNEEGAHAEDEGVDRGEGDEAGEAAEAEEAQEELKEAADDAGEGEAGGAVVARDADEGKAHGEAGAGEAKGSSAGEGDNGAGKNGAGEGGGGRQARVMGGEEREGEGGSDGGEAGEGVGGEGRAAEGGLPRGNERAKAEVRSRREEGLRPIGHGGAGCPKPRRREA